MRLAVIGCSDFEDRDRLFRVLDKNYEKITMILSLDASGADQMAREWAKERGVRCLIFYPKWRDLNGGYDRGAGMKKTHEMIKASDCVLAFWDGTSRGTELKVEIAHRINKPVKIVKIERVNEQKEECSTVSV